MPIRFLLQQSIFSPNFVFYCFTDNRSSCSYNNYVVVADDIYPSIGFISNWKGILLLLLLLRGHSCTTALWNRTRRILRLTLYWLITILHNSLSILLHLRRKTVAVLWFLTMCIGIFFSGDNGKVFKRNFFVPLLPVEEGGRRRRRNFRAINSLATISLLLAARSNSMLLLRPSLTTLLQN